MVDVATPLFSLGKCVSTPGAMELLNESLEAPLSLLRRHQQGDWGELCNEDRQANQEALECNARILSVYKVSEGSRIYVITEADRSSTCILLPDEY